MALPEQLQGEHLIAVEGKRDDQLVHPGETPVVREGATVGSSEPPVVAAVTEQEDAGPTYFRTLRVDPV